jgi:hypothetical protein
MTEEIGLKAKLDLSQFSPQVAAYTKAIQRMMALNREFAGSLGASPIDRLGQGLDDLTERIRRASDSASEGQGTINRFTQGLLEFGKFSVATGVTALTAAIGVGVTAGFQYNNMLQQASARIQAFTKDASVTASTIAMIKKEAAATPFTFGEMVTAAGALQPVMKASGESLKNLIKDAEILAASNPLQGLEGASFALREAVSGDFTSIIERFNLSRTTINRLKDEGVPAIEIVRQAMAEMGFDAGLVSEMANTMEGRWSTLSDTMTNYAGIVTQPMFDQMSESLGRLNEALENNEGTVGRWAEEWAGVTQRLADGLDSWTYVLLDAIPAINQHNKSLAEQAAQAAINATTQEELDAAWQQGKSDFEAFKAALLKGTSSAEQYNNIIRQGARDSYMLAETLSITADEFSAAKITIQQETVELQKNEGAAWMASYAASRLAAEQSKLAQSAGASSQALAAATARYQGLANAQRTMTNGHSVLETMAGGETLTGPEAERMAELSKQQEQFSKQSATAMTKSFDDAANDLRSTIEGVIKPSLDEVWKPAGEQTNIDEWARRVATIATSGFSSEWLTKASEQFGGEAFFKPILDAMQSGDEGALKGAANDLLTKNVTQLWDVETIKTKVREQLQQQNLRQQIIDQVQAELAAEGMTVSPEAVAAVAGGATQAAGGMTQVNQATTDMGATAGSAQVAFDNLGLALDTLSNVKIVTFITQTGKLQTAVGGMVTGVKTAGVDMTTALAATVPEMQKVIKQADWVSLGKSIDEGILKGIRQNEHLVYERLKALAKEALKQAGDAIGYGSPAALFVPLGMSIPEGVALGITNAAGLVQQAYDQMFGINRGVTNLDKLLHEARYKLTSFAKEHLSISEGKASFILDTIQKDFAANTNKILSAVDPLKAFQEIVHGHRWRGADIKEQDVAKIAERFYQNFLKETSKAQAALEKMIIEGSRKALDFAASLADVGLQSVSKLNTEVDSLAQLLNTGASEFEWDGQIISAAEAMDLFNQKMAEQRNIQDDIARNQELMAKQSFLEKQLALMETINKAGLDKSILGGLKLGLDAGAEDLLAATNRVIEAMINQVNQDLGIGSDSKVMAQIGEWTMGGFVKGIEKAQGLLDTVIQGTPVLRPAFVGGGAAGGNSVQFIFNGGITIANGRDEVQFVEMIKEKITEAF